MDELFYLHERFEQVCNSTPAGITFSDRVIDPVILIDYEDGRAKARLAGVRFIRGKRILLIAPSPVHNWVLDENIIRPLPNDVKLIFNKIIGKSDPNNLHYKDAIRLLRESDSLIAIEASESFLSSGSSSIDSFDSNLAITGLNANLFPYQAKGVGWMLKTISLTGGIILADEMGLGKTIQIIALLAIDPPKFDSPALIICPTSLIANWVQEFARFANGLSILVHRGPERAGIYSQLQKTNIVIATYDTVVNDISIFTCFEWSWVICDEAQAIKNPSSNRRTSIASIPRRRAIPMTGTPVENSLLDLWSLADFAIPGLLGTKSEFERDFPDTHDSAQELSKITKPIILKRRVDEVASDLPDRIEIDIPLELDIRLAEHYRSVRAETIAKYPVAGELVATLQLQIVCAHHWLRKHESENQDDSDTIISRDLELPLITPKMERLVEILEEVFLNKKKAIIFAIFNQCGDLIREACKNLPNAYWNSINGSTPQQERQPIIDAFTDYFGPACLILNPKAAGAGLNITAATVVIHFTPVWNPAIEAQASARAHRRGQKHPVTIYRLFYEDTIERVMIDRASWKRELGNEITPLASRDASDLAKALQIEPRILK